MTKDEIKALYTMRDVLQRYGLPQPSRAGFIRCPFHDEKTASMRIYEKDFHCFGCGAHGDVFTFVQEMEGLTFKEAFAELGGDYEDRSFSARLRIYQAQKRREAERKAAERLAQAKERTSLLMSTYRDWLDQLEPLSDAWADTYKALQYQEYIWELLDDQRSCHEVAKELI